VFKIKLRIPDFLVNPSILITSQVMMRADITRKKTVSKEVLNSPIFEEELVDEVVLEEVEEEEEAKIKKMERMEKTKDNKSVMVKEDHKFSSEKKPPGYWAIPKPINVKKRMKMAAPIILVVFK